MLRLSRFHSLVLLALLPLTGCGGGGGNGPATPTPTPTLPPLNRSCTASTYTPNYVANPNSEFELLRWPNFPLRVFFTQDAQNTAERRALVTQGFDKWVGATNNGPTYRVVSQPDQANVVVDFYRYAGGAGDELGRTTLAAYGESDTISAARVRIGFTGDNRNDEITATHEFGHALGINGHSPDADDLMFFEGNDTRSGALTPADINTLLTAYCGEFNRNANARTSPHRGKLRTITIR